MKRGLARLGLAVSFLLLWLPLAEASSVKQPIRVTVKAHTVDGKPAYTYQIINRSKQSILGFALGSDAASGEMLLSGSSPLKTASPANWQARIVRPDPAASYEIRWQPSFWEYRLKQGASSGGFTVVVDEPHPQYSEGVWTVLLAGEQKLVSAKLERAK